MLCSEEIIQEVWEKGTITANNDPKYWRQDECGAWMSRGSYGRQQSPYGWEIGFIRPQTEPGGQDLPNLRPLQWKNHVAIRGSNPACVVRAVRTENQDIPK